MQRNRHGKGVRFIKTRTVVRKSLIGGFTFAQGDLIFCKSDKISTDLKSFVFQFAGAEPTDSPRDDATGLNFPYAVIKTY